MNVASAIRSRRSTRRFSTREVTDAVLVELMDLSRHAPSSMDDQPWHFVIVRDRERLATIADIKNAHCPADKRDFPADFVRDAPVLVLIGVERAHAHNRGRESAILAAGFLLLAAHASGLGGVYLSAYDASTLADDLRAALDLPGAIDPVTLVPLGYPADTPAPKILRPLGDHIFPGTIDARLLANR